MQSAGGQNAQYKVLYKVLYKVIQSITKYYKVLQSAGGHNAQYKGETNDPVRHENAKGRKVSEIQDNIFQLYIKSELLLSELKM